MGHICPVMHLPHACLCLLTSVLPICPICPIRPISPIRALVMPGCTRLFSPEPPRRLGESLARPLRAHYSPKSPSPPFEAARPNGLQSILRKPCAPHIPMLAAVAAPRFSAARMVLVDFRLRRPARNHRVCSADAMGCYDRVRVPPLVLIHRPRPTRPTCPTALCASVGRLHTRPRHFIFHLSSLIIAPAQKNRARKTCLSVSRTRCKKIADRTTRCQPDPPVFEDNTQSHCFRRIYRQNHRPML